MHLATIICAFFIILQTGYSYAVAQTVQQQVAQPQTTQQQVAQPQTVQQQVAQPQPAQQQVAQDPGAISAKSNIDKTLGSWFRKGISSNYKTAAGYLQETPGQLTEEDREKLKGKKDLFENLYGDTQLNQKVSQAVSQPVERVQHGRDQPSSLLGRFIEMFTAHNVPAALEDKKCKCEGLPEESQITQQQVAQPQTAQPQVVQPQSTQQQVVQPQTVQPQMVQPQSTQQQVAQSQPTQRQIVQPQTTQPQVVQPQATQQQVAQPQTAQPKTAAQQFDLVGKIVASNGQTYLVVRHLSTQGLYYADLEGKPIVDSTTGQYSPFQGTEEQIEPLQ